jgi:hypothetical protein
MRRAAPTLLLIAAILWFGLAVFLAGITLFAVIKGRQFPAVLPFAAAIIAIVALRFLAWARHTPPRRK